jgi:YVTN family beta-propeller protein
VRFITLGLGRTRGRLMMFLTGVVCVAVVGAATAAVAGFDPLGTNQVGQQVSGGILLPTGQWISPLGKRLLDDKARLVSSTLSPDGTDVAALSWNNFQGYLTIMNVKTGAIVQQTELNTPAVNPTDSTVAADGPLYSSAGTTLWVPQSTYLLRFTVNPATGAATQTAAIPLCGNGDLTSTACNANDESGAADGSELPSGMALSPDGSKLYVALNGANALGVIDTATNTLTAKIPVGNAPRQVVLAGNGTTAYVSNEGGRPAQTGDFTNLSDGTPIVSNRSTGGAITGTVSVVNLTTGKETEEIPVGLQPTALYQDGSALFVANSNDDSTSVIDESTNTVSQTVKTNPVPGATVGSYANAISMSDPSHVLVSIGRDNAIAVYKYAGLTTPMQYLGLIPTDWYPVQVQPDPALGPHQLVVTNDKGIGDRGATPETISKGTAGAPTDPAGNSSVTGTGSSTNPPGGWNTYNDTGSVTTFALPSDSQLAAYTKRVFADNEWNQIHAVNAGVGDTVPAVIPSRIGGHSPIKHVVVIVKENRTYDQVLGDLGEGNSDPSYAQFGKTVTPNLHAMAYRFGDFDNFYDEGTLSADGHNWIVQAEANDYVEKEFGAFYRSYPAQGGDALAYQRDGFLWNAAQRAGLSVADFGEYANFFNVPSSADSWDEWYKDSQILEGKASGPLPIPIRKYQTYADIPSLNAIIDPYYPKFDLNVPDQYRVDIWKRAFDRYERSGHLPNLSLMWVPDDHTASPGSGDPDPVAEVADNDLAVGRIVSTISHSRWWKSTAIFVLEDDPQNGIDHVDGHRSVLWVASPYSRARVNDDNYSQINVVRTIEQILGIKPMNQEDHSAVPMYSAFTSQPDFAPYNVRPNQVPLTVGAPGYPASEVATPSVRKAAEVPASERIVYNAWVAWGKHQRFNGRRALEDYAKPALLNRLDWYSAHGWKVVYPGDTKIYPPDQVPGRNLPAEDLDG